MRALFIGLGSIGQRHLQNFQRLMGENSCEVIAYRHGDLQNIIENGEAIHCGNIAAHYGFKAFNNFKDVIVQTPDISFICNPNRLHIETAIPLAEIGSDLFIEKPLGTGLDLLDELEKNISLKKLTTMVGFQSRFHPCIRKVKKILQEKKFGNVISAQFNWSNYLPYFHPYEDYRKGYAAREDLGGGVTFTYCHELDIIQHFFDIPESVYAVGGHLSKLEMDADDTIIALFKCKGKLSSMVFPVSLHLSLGQGQEERKFTILMDDVYIECDIKRNRLKIQDHEKNTLKEKEYNNLERNDLFLKEMAHFLDCVKKRNETFVPVSEGKKSLLMSLAIHKSLKTGHVEPI
ncbi:Gfo/Idh/MocA family oxidoreductase [candidate division KSB1 bacterium]|nr:Gfo/Idh/MocA family oxidoreductase [candidate division KSB1 bacterium]